MSISLKDICKSYGEHSVVDRVSLEILTGELFVLLGASGSGKTTVLRMIAGLAAPDTGEILLKGERVNHVSPQQRNIGFVFQNYSLFRHMTVSDNIGFGLRIRKAPAKERNEKINRLLELIGLPGFGDRYPSQLSGGQQQRIAVARALAYEPQVLLLDEPFGALDLKTRVQLRQSLKNIHLQLGITTVLVTHDQGDAFELGDRIGVMERGKLFAVGPPTEVYKRPKTEYVAQFLGPANFFTGQMQEDQVQIGTAFLPLPKGMSRPEKGARVKVMIRPEDMEIVSPSGPLQGTFLGEGVLQDFLFAGSSYRVMIRIPGIVRSGMTGPGDTDPTLLYGQVGLEKEKVLPIQCGQKVAVGVVSFHILPYEGLRILVGIDGSEQAEHALQFGTYLAKTTQGSISILGVAERYLEEGKAREGLLQAGQTAQKEIQEVTTYYRRGHPSQEILNETEKSGYDLVVLGTRGRHAPPHFIGSTAGRVSMNAPIPTLLTPTPLYTLQHLMICISGEKMRKGDIRFIGRIARSTGAKATLFHVRTERDSGQVAVYLQEVLQILENLGINTEIKNGTGETVSAILEEATGRDYDLLVLGTRVGNLREAFLTQSVTSEILSRIDLPVLVLHVKPPQ
jgi:sulfate transport system ATP-binding protein